MKVWSAPPGHGLVKRSLAIHRAFYRMMGGMLDEIESEHCRFVLLDLPSSNYRRSCPAGDPAPQDEAPAIKIGTFSMPPSSWALPHAPLMEAMSSSGFRSLPLALLS